MTDITLFSIDKLLFVSHGNANIGGKVDLCSYMNNLVIGPIQRLHYLTEYVDVDGSDKKNDMLYVTDANKESDLTLYLAGVVIDKVGNIDIIYSRSKVPDKETKSIRLAIRCVIVPGTIQVYSGDQYTEELFSLFHDIDVSTLSSGEIINRVKYLSKHHTRVFGLLAVIDMEETVKKLRLSRKTNSGICKFGEFPTTQYGCDHPSVVTQLLA